MLFVSGVVVYKFDFGFGFVVDGFMLIMLVNVFFFVVGFGFDFDIVGGVSGMDCGGMNVLSGDFCISG